MTQQGSQALLVAADAYFWIERNLIARLASSFRIPSMFAFAEYVQAGGLMSYGVDTREGLIGAASYVAKILAGAKPADLPVEQPTKFQLVINLKTAKALGITMPQSLLLRSRFCRGSRKRSARRARTRRAPTSR